MVQESRVKKSLLNAYEVIYLKKLLSYRSIYYCLWKVTLIKISE